MYLSEETKKRLEKHDSLRAIVFATYNETYDPIYLSPLTQWYRMRYNDRQEELVENILHWDNDTIEDFYSWGHNSRWRHTFEADMECNFDDYVNTAIDIEEGEYDEDNDD